MKLSALPPVRRAVPLTRGSAEGGLSMERFFGNRPVTLYPSGTAALAEAIAQSAAQSSVSAAEVIIPAYGCPDLVAACIHASMRPRLVDVAPSHWSYDTRALKSSLSSSTVAVVAVNLLGIGDGSADLIDLCRERHITLIQDSAQYLPRESLHWPGDYMVLSFGRGKPLNLLHGGALIGPRGERNTASVPLVRYTARARLLSSRAAALAFNGLTRPVLYGIFSALPGTGLGKVIYKPLTHLTRLPERAGRRVAAAFEQYLQEPSYRRDIWTPLLEEWSELGITAYSCPGIPPPSEPLRLALLAPNRFARDELVDNLHRAGLGASRFYATALTGVTGIPEVVKRQGPFPNANVLADRLFTLPTHSLVNSNTIRAARAVVRAWHRSTFRVAAY